MDSHRYSEIDSYGKQYPTSSSHVGGHSSAVGYSIFPASIAANRIPTDPTTATPWVFTNDRAFPSSVSSRPSCASARANAWLPQGRDAHRQRLFCVRQYPKSSRLGFRHQASRVLPGEMGDYRRRVQAPRERAVPYGSRRGQQLPTPDRCTQRLRGQSCLPRSGSFRDRYLSYNVYFLVRRVLVTEFEFARCVYLVGCVVFVNESEVGLSTVFTEDVTQRPPIDISEPRAITSGRGISASGSSTARSLWPRRVGTPPSTWGHTTESAPRCWDPRNRGRNRIRVVGTTSCRSRRDC